MRSFAQSPDPCLLVLVLDLHKETQLAAVTNLTGPYPSTFSSYAFAPSLLTSLVSAAACVTAATAAAQAGAALVQTIGHQTWYVPSFRTVI